MRRGGGRHRSCRRAPGLSMNRRSSILGGLLGWRPSSLASGIDVSMHAPISPSRVNGVFGGVKGKRGRRRRQRMQVLPRSVAYRGVAIRNAQPPREGAIGAMCITRQTNTIATPVVRSAVQNVYREVTRSQLFSQTESPRKQAGWSTSAGGRKCRNVSCRGISKLEKAHL